MKLKPFQFGNVTIDFPVVLAPMAGYTDAAFRFICKEHGAGACYTEVTSAEGIRRDSRKTFQLLEVSGIDHPIAGHIFGKSVEAMVEAARYIEQLGCFDWIDINCGCPVRKVVRRGAGAALMKEPEEIGEIVRAVKKAVSLPVTVKTRIGFSPAFPDHLTIAKIVEDSGADMIAVHGRMACNFHKGDADLEKIGEVKQALSIPVIGNGGIETPEDAAEMVRVSGVDGVMIARGAVGNPWLFEQIFNLWTRSEAREALPQSGKATTDGSGNQAEPAPENFPNIGNDDGNAPRSAVPQRSCFPDLGKRREVIEAHLSRLVELNEKSAAERRRKTKFEPEAAACLTFRPHLVQYLKGLRGCRELMQHLNEMHDVQTIMDAVDRVLDRNVDAVSPPR